MVLFDSQNTAVHYPPCVPTADRLLLNKKGVFSQLKFPSLCLGFLDIGMWVLAMASLLLCSWGEMTRCDRLEEKGSWDSKVTNIMGKLHLEIFAVWTMHSHMISKGPTIASKYQCISTLVHCYMFQRFKVPSSGSSV
jgi:hypothetical protein